jgi:hypothetical protein
MDGTGISRKHAAVGAAPVEALGSAVAVRVSFNVSADGSRTVAIGILADLAGAAWMPAHLSSSVRARHPQGNKPARRRCARREPDRLLLVASVSL